MHDHAATERLAAIIDWSDDAIISKSLDGIIQSWNRAAERMFGYTSDEAVGQSITIIIPPDRLSEEEHVIAQIRRGEPVDHFETIRRRKDGTLLPISLTISPIRAADGTVIGASKIARDISERRRAEAALAASEASQTDLRHRLLALVAASGTLFGSPRLEDVVPGIIVLARTLLQADAYALWRLDEGGAGWRIAASAGLSDGFGRIEASYRAPAVAPPSGEPIIAEAVQEVPMLEHRAAVYREEGIESLLAVPLTIAGQGTGSLVCYHRRRHTFSDVETQTARALGNLAAAAIASAELYDEQRRMREAAERAKRRSAFLAEASAALGGSLDYEATLRTVAQLAVPQIADACAVDIVDEHGAVQRLAAAHLDPRRAEIVRTLRERFPEKPDAPGNRLDVIRTGTPASVPALTDEMLTAIAVNDEHLRLLRELGFTSYIAVPLAAHGAIFGAITFALTDIRRSFGDEDLRFAQDVAYRAAIAIENARAYRQANAANRAKDEFLAMVSHELRTPLNAVLGWARMLRAGSIATARMPKAFEVIERNAVAQLDLVEDLLDLSRIVTGKFRLHVVPVDVRAVIEAAVESIQPAANAKNIAVELDLGCAGVPLAADRSRLQQAVWNLLANAIKFTPRGGRVRVSLSCADGQVDIVVSDTGEGIHPSVLPFVFDRFRQGETGTARTHAGLGLGLSIVRSIVELHGGRVEASSPGPGQGATFRLMLPSAAGAPSASAPGPQRLAAGQS